MNFSLRFATIFAFAIIVALIFRVGILSFRNAARLFSDKELIPFRFGTKSLILVTIAIAFVANYARPFSPEIEFGPLVPVSELAQGGSVHRFYKMKVQNNGLLPVKLRMNSPTSYPIYSRTTFEKANWHQEFSTPEYWGQLAWGESFDLELPMTGWDQDPVVVVYVKGWRGGVQNICDQPIVPEGKE